MCTVYAEQYLRNLLEAHSQGSLKIKVASFLRNSSFQMKDLISQVAEQKLISWKSFTDQFQIWEFLSPGIYLETDRLKSVSHDKQARAKLVSKLKTLDKVVCLIDKLKDDKDIAKIELEYSKFTSVVEKEEQA